MEVEKRPSDSFSNVERSDGHDNVSHQEQRFEHQFYGIQKVILMKKLGHKWDKILVITGIILVAWAKNWEGNLVYSASVQIYSAFNSLSISALVDVVLYIVQTILLPMYAKFSDMVGRTEAFAMAIFFYVISGVIQATAQNMDTLIGGQVIYAFGLSGVTVLGHVLIADITSSANRGIFQAFYDFPAMINIWVAPIAGTAIAENSSWRWCYSMIPFCIGTCSIPLLYGLFKIEKTVKKSGQMPPKDDSKYRNLSFFEKVKFIGNEMDAIGSLLFIGALGMILVPLILGPSRWGWSSSITIGCLVGGFVCALVFVFYEMKIAEHPVIPVADWDTTTPMAAVMVCAIISSIRAINWTYFMTYLQITRYATPLEATYIDRSYHAMFLVSQLAGGFIMKKYKIYRPVVLAGICFYILGMGLMIPSRYPTSPLGFVIISQIIAGLGSGMIYVPCLVAAQSSVPHGDLAIVTALMSIGGTIATSVGGTIAGAIWNSLLPGQLASHVPGEFDASQILGNITYIHALFPEQHNGATIAYGEVQRILSIVALCLAVLALAFWFRMKSFGLTEHDHHDTEHELTEKERSPNEQIADDYSIAKTNSKT
ncbi:RNA polymerase C-22 sterol desaturase [Mucor velutinosus]|uniref:RNA polymerase C-22 sterol desaturase n=1 Tax=Mucor velutinosus TaxID=708070 RepID=A0AAN7D923_9FUNG|nr:RNA polymerase C-22 sterol desaturase [Mucor velutinosus]